MTFNLKNMFKDGLLTMLLLFAVGAFAASKGGLQLQHPTNVGGKQLATGTYSVQWDGIGDQVALKVFQGKKEVASTSAHVVKGSERAEHRVRAAKPQNQLQLRPRVRSTPEEPECTRPRLRCFLQPRSADVRQPFAARKSAGLWQITLSQRH